ncbi:hypothetical protein JCM16303_004093 [Sporobolomyces ruberrimus]
MELPPPLPVTYENLTRLVNSLRPDLVPDEATRKWFEAIKSKLLEIHPGIWKQLEVLRVTRYPHGRPTNVLCTRILIEAVSAAASTYSDSTLLRHQEKTLRTLNSQLNQINRAACNCPETCKLTEDLKRDLKALTIEDWRLLSEKFSPSTTDQRRGVSLAEALVNELETDLSLCRNPDERYSSNVVRVAIRVETELRDYQYSMFHYKAESIPANSGLPEVDELRRSLCEIPREVFGLLSSRREDNHRESARLSEMIDQLVKWICYENQLQGAPEVDADETEKTKRSIHILVSNLDTACAVCFGGHYRRV